MVSVSADPSMSRRRPSTRGLVESHDTHHMRYIYSRGRRNIYRMRQKKPGRAMMSRKLAAAMALLAGLALAPVARGQVVNIESQRMQTDSVRTAGGGSLAILVNGANGRQVVTLRGNALVQRKSRDLRQIWLLSANYDLARAGGESIVNNFHVHLRHNYKVGRALRWEAFAQHQGSPPLGIQARRLLGTGPRIKLGLWPGAEAYLGTAAMYEHERAAGPAPEVSRGVRSSSYASVSIRFKRAGGSVVGTAYFQPMLGDPGDCRVMVDTRASFSIAQRWRAYASLGYLVDTRPPAGVRRSAVSFEQGFGLTF